MIWPGPVSAQFEAICHSVWPSSIATILLFRVFPGYTLVTSCLGSSTVPDKQEAWCSTELCQPSPGPEGPSGSSSSPHQETQHSEQGGLGGSLPPECLISVGLRVVPVTGQPWCRCRVQVQRPLAQVHLFDAVEKKLMPSTRFCPVGDKPRCGYGQLTDLPPSCFPAVGLG